MRLLSIIRAQVGVVLVTMGIAGCGGSSAPAPPPVISVAFSGTPATSLVVSTSTSLTAVVSNDSANAGVKWTVTCGASACGSFSAAATPSGTATSYTAPGTIPSPATVTVVATSATDATKTATVTITIVAAPPPPISVTFNPAAPTTLVAGATSNLTAVVSNDTANAGVKWTVTCGSSACGSFSAATTASGTATVYTAPTVVPSPATVTVTATSVTDSTKTAQATITITATSALSVTFNPAAPTTLAVGTTSNLTAVVSNDTANAGVKWTVTCGSSACGSFSVATTASGTATVYTAPSAVPSPATVTVTATSVTDSTKTAQATITITPPLPDGTYVYNLSGTDGTGPYFVVGAFTVKGGTITAGEQDFRNITYRSTDMLSASGSSLSTAGGNIQIVLATGNSNIGVSGNETLRGAVVSSTRVLISEFDTYGAATGSIDLQTSTAAPSGGYAFAVQGVDGSTNELVFGLGGVLNINGTSLTTTNSVFDYNDGGNTGQAELFSAGTVSAPDQYGRLTITLTPTGTSGVPVFTFTGYPVSASRMQLVESQTDALGAALGGVALGQGSNTNNFSASSVLNTSYTYGANGADVFGSSAIAGVLSFNASGALGGSMALNDITNFTTTTITGIYTVDATGRATLTNVVPSSLSGQGANFTFQVYLDGNGNALMLGVDTQQVNEGPAYKQTATSTDFEGTYALSTGGFLDATGFPAFGAVGPVVVNNDAFTGTTDYTAQTANPFPAVSLTGTENSGTGALSLTGLNAISFTTANAYSYFRIDGTRVIANEVDGESVNVLMLEGVSH